MFAESQNCEASNRQLLLGNGSANMLVARKWFSKLHVTADMLTYAKIEELLEAVFPVLSITIAASHCNQTTQEEVFSGRSTLRLYVEN
jgi:hypothetical protein